MSIFGIISSSYPVSNSGPLAGTYYGPQWLYKYDSTEGQLKPEGMWNLAVQPNTSIFDGRPVVQYRCWDLSGNPNDRWVSPNLNATGILTGTSDLTIEMWFYPRNSGMILMTEQGSATENSGWHATVLEINSDSTISCRLWSGAELSIVDTVNIDAWNHVWLQYNSATTTLKVRLNNGTVYSSPSGYNRNSNYFTGGAVHFAVGHTDITNLGNAARYYGKLAQVRINGWCAPSSYWEEAEHYQAAGTPVVQDSSLKAWWNGMTLPDGPNWNDVSGNSYVMVNNNSWTHNSGVGYYEYATGAYGQSNAGLDHFGTDGTPPYQTITAWVWAEPTDSDTWLLGFENGTNYDHNVRLLNSISSNYLRHTIRTAGGFDYLDSISYTAENLYGRWVHIGMRLTGGGNFLTYVNGKHAGSASTGGNFGSTFGLFYLRNPNLAMNSAVRFADIQFHDRALSEDEILRNYCFAKYRLGL